MQFPKSFLAGAALLAVTLAPAQGGLFKHKKYENPITKDTLQPDKVLFDRAIGDIEHGRYEIARLTLNTLINTYDSSEYLAKAKLAIADSWYREGGAHGLAQAEAEYKDFELFYPTMEESSEAQWRVCQIHYKQMEKVDRDNSQALRAEDECKQMVTAYPNSHYAGQATQMLRNVQEVLAAKEFRTGAFYHTKGSFPAAASRLAFVSQQYPLFSSADEALWQEADAFKHMGDRFDEQQAAALSKLVQQYPISDHVDEAKDRLTEMKKPIPPADPAAYERMKYDMEAYQKPGLFSRTTDFLKRGPDTSLAAKTGAPSMATVRPPTPVSVPAVAADTSGAGSTVGGTTDVTAGVVGDATALDTGKEQRAPRVAGEAVGTPEAGTAGAPGTATPAAAPQQPLATNHPYVETKKQKKKRLKMQEEQQKKQQDAPATATPASTLPSTSGTPAAAAGAAATSTPAPASTPAAAPPQ